MNPSDLITKIQSFVYVLRRGQKEKILAFLALGLFSCAVYVRQELEKVPHALQIAYALFAASAFCALWLFLRIWKQAAPPPPPPDAPMPSAIKGLLPFTVADGSLFSRLGRRTELQMLLGIARNDQIGISAVRGQSGAGKTSLLQAGLAYTLGEEHCIYWEAMPAKAPEALLHATRARIPGLASLESLPDACPNRCVLILDQFEQLSPSEPEHAAIFALLERIANSPAPHNLSAIVGFRREFLPDWADFEQSLGFHAEQVPVNLLAPTTASDALVTLAGEAGFTLDYALVESLIASIGRQDGVSPVDIAIGVLSLANFVQQRGIRHVGMTEYKIAGGTEGLLLSFVQQKLEEIPEPVRAPLLKGVVLALVDLSNNQRISEGATAAAIASTAETSESSLIPWLERLAHPRIRILEHAGPRRYRLPHERLVPVLRRLTGRALASMEQLKLTFETEFARWRATRIRRHLLGGEELRDVLRHRDQLVQGDSAAAKGEYLTACRWHRTGLRFATCAIIIAFAAAGYQAYRYWDASIQRQKLVTQGLPPWLFEAQGSVDSLELSYPISDLTWLRSARLRYLSLSFRGSSLAGLERLRGLTSLSLTPGYSRISSLTGLEQLKGLTSLSLDLRGSQIASLADLERIDRLTSLSLDLGDSQITSLAGMEQFKGLTSLSLDLSNSQITKLAALKLPQGLTSLSLTPSFSPIPSLAGLKLPQGLTSLSIPRLAGLKLPQGLTSLSISPDRNRGLADLNLPQGLTSLSLFMDTSQIASLVDLKLPERLTSFSLNLTGFQITGPAGLEQLKKLTSLSLYLASNIPSLAGLKLPNGLTSLSLNLEYVQIPSLTGLELPSGLTSLSLDLRNSQILSFAGLNLPHGLTSLSLDLRDSQIPSLAGLNLPHGLTSLSLSLMGSKINSLAGLEFPDGLTSADVTISSTLDLSRLKVRRDIISLRLVVEGNHTFDIPGGFKFVGLIIQ